VHYGRAGRAPDPRGAAGPARRPAARVAPPPDRAGAKGPRADGPGAAAREEEHGRGPWRAQGVEQLGRELVDIVLVPEAQRVLVLAAGSTEIFGLRLFEEELIGEGEVDEPAYTGHARFMEFLRAGDGSVHPPRLFAAGPNSLALVTDKEVIELFHLDRSYRVLGRSPIPQGVARIDAMVHAGSRWIASGLNEKAEPVVLWAEELAGAWRDMDVDAIDAALEVDGERIAWLPGRFSVTDEHVAMAVRGERGAVVRWPVESVALEADAIEVTWLTPTGHAPRK